MGDVNIGDKEEAENRKERARGHGVLNLHTRVLDPRYGGLLIRGLVESSRVLAEELKVL